MNPFVRLPLRAVFSLAAATLCVLPCSTGYAQAAASAPAAAASAPSAKKPQGPARWEKDIAAFEKADAANPPKKGGIVFVGSSSIRMWKTLVEDFPKHHVLNRGFGGSQISDSIHFADRIVIPYAPRKIFVYAGANDISAKKTPAKVLADFKTFVAKVRAKLPDVPIAFISIAGNPARWNQVEQVKEANKLVAEYCKSAPNLTYIDVFSEMLGSDGLPKANIFIKDRLHMNGEGYKIWTDVIGKHLGAPDVES